MLVASSGLALAQSEAANVLPAGSPLTFVCDDAVNTKTVRPGGTYKVHLRNPLVLDGTTIAPIGTLARLVVLDKKTENGTATVTIGIVGFNVHGGELPVTPVKATFATIEPGTLIETRTQGSVEERNGRTIIRVPLPFALPADTPNAFFTPVPARTNAGRIFSPRPVRRPTAKPTPTPTPSPSPSAAETEEPGETASPS